MKIRPLSSWAVHPASYSSANAGLYKPGRGNSRSAAATSGGFMRERWVIGRTRFVTRMAAVAFSAVTVFAPLGVSACTGGSTPGADASASSSFFTAKAPGTPSPTLTNPTPAPTPTLTEATFAPTPAPATSSPPPAGAPATGGGGTAGLQHLTLFGLGAVAVLAGLVSLLYRRRTLRGR